VKCLRSVPVPPLTDLETQFAERIADGGLNTTETCCAVVDALHALVESNTVRRRVAGALASELRVGLNPYCDTWSVSYLWRVLEAPTQRTRYYGKKHCDCVARVLSWGTCPHVSFSYNTSGGTSTFFVVGTALVMISFMLSDAVYAKALLDAGCPP
jgi:hypothetical protein